MGEFPDDIMGAARDAYADALKDSFRAGSVKIIARAIMAERQRCADIARASRNHWVDDSFARFDEAVTILEAIERGDHV